MKKVGLVVAVEIDAVLGKYGDPVEKKIVGNMDFLTFRMPEYELICVHCGAGEIAAAAAVQLLITAYEADMIVDFGVVGGLTREMALSKTCIVEKVIHYDFDISSLDPVRPGQYSELPDVYIPTDPVLFEKARKLMPELKSVICASGDKFVDGEEKKKALHEQTGADICEMEAAAVALTSYRNHVPCLIIKCVSDAIEGGGEEFYREMLKSSEICLETADRLIRDIA